MDEIETFDGSAIIKKCKDFLERCDSRYSEDITEQERALEIAGGKFWDVDTKKRWAIYNDKDPEHDLIPVIPYNNVSSQVNAIASPFSKSPFHINVLDKENLKDLQDKITQFEGSNIVKNVYNRAFTRGVTCAAGYITISYSRNGDSLVPSVEFATNQSMIAVDPNCETPDCSDAEEGAIVSYYSIPKAKREFGKDVIADDFPKTQPELSFSNIKTWGDKTDKVQVVKYFRKEDVEGQTIVRMYTICGNYVSEPVNFPCSIIPIVRFSGYNDYDATKGLCFTGYVQKMLPNIELMSLGLTMQANRMRKASSVRIVVGKKSTQGCEDYIKDFEKASSIALVWNDKDGNVPPQIVQDSFATGDIASVMDMTRQSMMDMSGVNLAGLQSTPERTAYEVMQQQVNSESNVQELFLNAEAACNTLAKIVLSILTGGMIPAFTLEGGPSVITTQMKERAEIQAIQPLVSPEQMPLLAIAMANTIDSEVGKNLAQDIKANSALQFTEGQDVGSAMSTSKKLKDLLDQTMAQLEQVNKQMAELQKENDSLNTALQNQEWQHRFDMLKLQIDTKNNEAQLAIDNANEAHKLKQEDAKILMQMNANKVKTDNEIAKLNATNQREQLKLQGDILKAQAEKDKILTEMQRDEERYQREVDKANREAAKENMIYFNPQE